MAALALPAPHQRTEPRRGLITMSLMLATIMQVLDSTIANVALPHMQASLGAAQDTITWVLTSYIVASAIALPLTGWLADRIGRKRLLLIATIGFVIASMLCGIAQGLTEMVLFRVAQGVFGAFIVPLSQAVMLDVYPKHRHGYAMAIWGMGVMIGPIIGPVLGGWLTDNFDWRWVFYVNLPIGICALLGTWLWVPEAPIRQRSFDLFGFALIAMGVASLQLMLDRGEQLDWFESTEVMIECGFAIAGFWMFGVHLMTARRPLFAAELLADRNFVMGCVFIAIIGVLVYSTMALVPPMLQRLYGYPIITAGLLTAPRGIGLLLSMRLVGAIVHRVDPRALIVAGLATTAYSLHQMSGLSLAADERLIIISGLVQGVGIGLINVPLNTLAFATIQPHLRTDAASLYNLLRNVGSSIGISVVTVLLARNIQISHAELAAAASQSLGAVATLAGSPAMLGDAAVAMVDAEINRQASMIAYINDYYAMMWATIIVIPLVFLLRRPKQEQDGAEMRLAME